MSKLPGACAPGSANTRANSLATPCHDSASMFPRRSGPKSATDPKSSSSFERDPYFEPAIGVLYAYLDWLQRDHDKAIAAIERLVAEHLARAPGSFDIPPLLQHGSETQAECPICTAGKRKLDLCTAPSPPPRR